MLNKLHNMSAHMFFKMGVADFFAPPIFPHANHARACAQRAPAHWRARQRTQALLFHHAQAHVFLQHVGHVQPRQHHREHQPPRLNWKHAMRTRARRQPTKRPPRVRRLSFSPRSTCTPPRPPSALRAGAPRTARPRAARTCAADWTCGVRTSTTPCVVSSCYPHRIPPDSLGFA